MVVSKTRLKSLREKIGTGKKMWDFALKEARKELKTGASEEEIRKKAKEKFNWWKTIGFNDRNIGLFEGLFETIKEENGLENKE